MRWLLLHYPPLLDGSNAEMAARQAAVWHFSDGFMPDSERAWQIINSVPDDPCAADQPSISITPASAVTPINTTQTLTVTVTRSGTPVSGQAVALSTDQGTLNTDAVTTDDQGQATFTLTHDTPDTTSHVNATAEMLLPVGTIFVGTEINKQKLVLGEVPAQPTTRTSVDNKSVSRFIRNCSNQCYFFPFSRASGCLAR